MTDWFSKARQADREREDRATDPSYAARYSTLAIIDALKALLEINRHRDRHGVAICFWGTEHPGVEVAFRTFAKAHPKVVELREDNANNAVYLERRDSCHQFACWYRKGTQ